METSLGIRLPSYRTALIGRAEETAAITALLRAAGSRLITLVGESGAGKTRLALEVAAGVAAAFPDGVVFVALAPVLDPDFVLPTLAATLDIEQAGAEPLAATIRRALQGKRLLLLIDNIEQVRAAAPALADLLADLPDLRMLVTSQVALETPPEIVYPVPVLSVPTAEHGTHDLQAIAAVPAVALFIDRMTNVQPDFVLTAANVPAVIEICQRVAGFPLAIELIAAHSASLSPQILAVLLRNHLTIHAFRPRKGGSRDDILGPVLDWCYSRLSEPARQLFRRLGIFLGGWTLGAVDPVCRLPGEAEWPLPQMLEMLVEKNLVLDETLPGQHPRFVMLDAVRAYATAMIHRAREDHQIAAQHAAFYVALSQEAELKLRGAEQVATLASLDEELHNIRAALAWSLGHAPEQALRIGSALFLFWSYRAYFSEGHRWLSQALASPPDAQRALGPADLAKAWRVRGVLAWYQNDYPSAMADYERSRELFVAAGDAAGLIGVLNSIALVHQEQGDIPQATRIFEEARARLADLPAGSPPRQHLTAVIENNLGGLYQEQGRLADAADCYATAIAIHRANENIGYVQGTLCNLGVIAEARGDYARARQYYQESLDFSRQLESAFDVADCLYNLGNVDLAEGADDAAAARYAEALPLAESMGSQRLQAKLLQAQGALARLRGQPEAADELLARALELVQGIGEVRDTAEVWLGLAMLANDRRDLARARECLRQAAALSRQVNDQLALTVCLEESAILRAHCGLAAEARRYAAAAVGLHQRLGSAPSPREHQRLLAAVQPDPAAAPEDAAPLIDALLSDDR